MPRSVWRLDPSTGELIPLNAEAAVRDNAAPNVIGDTCEPTWHPADGKVYESKSQFRRVTKAHGNVEFGDIKDLPVAPEFETSGHKDSIFAAREALQRHRHERDPIERMNKAAHEMREILK